MVDSPLRPRRSGEVDGIQLAAGVGLLLGLAGFVVGARIIADNSLLTHLATGDLLVDSGRVPLSDPYSMEFAGREWTVQSWLASLVYSRAVDLGGESALRVLHGGLAWLVMVGLWSLVAPARQLLTRVGLTVVPLVIGGTFWSPRPFMFGLVGLVVVLRVLRGHLRPWVLIPTMWLWVNTHGSFPLALVLLGAAGVGAVIDRRRPPVDHIRLAAWTVAGIMVGGLNPIGPRLWWFPLQLLGRNEALERVVEWSPPDFAKPAEYVYLGLLAIVVLGARRSMPWADLLPAAGFFATGLLAVRNIVPASVVVVAMAAPSLAGLVGRETGERAGLVARAASAAALAGLAVSVFAVFTAPGLSLDRYPVDAVSYLDERGLVANPEVVLVHREGVGNYLTYRYGPSANVFIDDRFDFYPVSQTRDHIELLYGSEYDEVLDRHRADVVLWERDSALGHWLEDAPGWSLAFRDDEWVIACRGDSGLADRCSP